MFVLNNPKSWCAVGWFEVFSLEFKCHYDVYHLTSKEMDKARPTYSFTFKKKGAYKKISSPQYILARLCLA